MTVDPMLEIEIRRRRASAVEEARATRRCRICGGSVDGSGTPLGWSMRFVELVYPVRVRLDGGREFAHVACLERRT